MRPHFLFFFLIKCLLFYELSFLYFPFYKFKPIGLEKIEFLRVCKPNSEVQNHVALLVTGVASKKPISVMMEKRKLERDYLYNYNFGSWADDMRTTDVNPPSF